MAPFHPPLTPISNAAATAYREYFGRGPGAVKTYAFDDLVVCVLTDVFTPSEQVLIEAGEGARVGVARSIHQQAIEEDYKERIEAVIGRPVLAYVGAIRMDPDLAVDTFMLGPS